LRIDVNRFELQPVESRIVCNAAGPESANEIIPPMSRIFPVNSASILDRHTGLPGTDRLRALCVGAIMSLRRKRNWYFTLSPLRIIAMSAFTLGAWPTVAIARRFKKLVGVRAIEMDAWTNAMHHIVNDADSQKLVDASCEFADRQFYLWPVYLASMVLLLAASIAIAQLGFTTLVIFKPEPIKFALIGLGLLQLLIFHHAIASHDRAYHALTDLIAQWLCSTRRYEGPWASHRSRDLRWYLLSAPFFVAGLWWIGFALLAGMIVSESVSFASDMVRDPLADFLSKELWPPNKVESKN